MRCGNRKAGDPARRTPSPGSVHRVPHFATMTRSPDPTTSWAGPSSAGRGGTVVQLAPAATRGPRRPRPRPSPTVLHRPDRLHQCLDDRAGQRRDRQRADRSPLLRRLRRLVLPTSASSATNTPCSGSRRPSPPSSPRRCWWAHDNGCSSARSPAYVGRISHRVPPEGQRAAKAGSAPGQKFGTDLGLRRSRDADVLRHHKGRDDSVLGACFRVRATGA